MTKILIVDDEPLIVYSLAKTLKHDWTTITSVTNGKDALREIRGAPYDICFLDVQLPDANGLDLMKIIRDVSPATRIIIMTAGCMNDEQLQSLRSQGCYFFPKPFDLDQAHSLVAEISGHTVPGEA
jgi:DNA-binding NtrC family response regulator